MKNKSLVPLMIDSGAYSAWSRGSAIDLDEYIAFIKKHNLHRIEGVTLVNLDVIGEGEASYKNWLKMRDAGINTLPVYHVVTSTDWLEKYLEECDYVGIGAISEMSYSKRALSLDRLWQDYLIDSKTDMPKYKCHGMGITSLSLVQRYPWYSVDSTSWLRAGAFGKVFIPRRTAGEWDFSRQPTVLAFSDQSPRRKDKEQHYDTVSDLGRKYIDKYLEFVNVSLEDVKTNHKVRCTVNAIFYAKFAATLKWPRPFRTLRRKGFFV